MTIRRWVSVITDLQFGSTGKGLFAGWLAKRINADTVVAAWGPNAGHTFVDREGKRNVHIMLPCAVHSPSVKRVLIGPGSVIDEARLFNEIEEALGYCNQGLTIGIHENAMVLSLEHSASERMYGARIGSTMKGNGEAIIEKIKRNNPLCVAGKALLGTPLEGYLLGVEDYNVELDKSEVLVVEGAQGFSLSINHGFYPYTTGRDCTTGQILADCAIPAQRNWGDFKVYGVARTYPIRVANRYGSCECQMGFSSPSPTCAKCKGTGTRLVGTSGPGYWDQQEIGWAAIGREPELTTVTKLPRRLFTFSGEQVRQAIRMNGVDEVFLNFCNYVRDPLELASIIDKIEAAGAPVKYTGWGEREDQVHAVRHKAVEEVF